MDISSLLTNSTMEYNLQQICIWSNRISKANWGDDVHSPLSASAARERGLCVPYLDGLCHRGIGTGDLSFTVWDSYGAEASEELSESVAVLSAALLSHLCRSH